ncbi:ATP-binding protein [Ramlibacter sp. AN1133]|uniref:ATP-binding protein n=1 Tax=Ramlibacter sp. AN1133 TaxID=3133429 RepID=UPI0030BE139D
MLHRSPPLRSLAAVCLASFVLAAGLLLAFGSFTPLWYANAVGVVALLRHPRSTWPVLLAAIYAANALAFSFFGDGPALLYAACHAVEIGLVGFLMQRFAGMPGPLLEGTRFARMAAVFLLVPAPSAAAAALVGAWTQAVSFPDAFQAWYLASALGLLVGGVSLLGWTDAALRKAFMQQLSRRRTAMLVGGALVCALLVHERHHQAAIFLTFPLMFAVTWYFGLLGATAGLLLTTLSAVIETLQGHGAFTLLAPPGSGVVEGLESVQLYLAALLLSSVSLAVLHEKQNELTQRVRSAAQARSEFLASMSHEIRTPLTGVLGMADLLAADELTARQQGYVASMRTSGRHLLCVVNDILDFSRIESGRLELEQAEFEVPELAEGVRSIMHPLAAERGIALEIELASPFPSTLVGDALRIRQVLLNLIGNAIKFTSAGGVHVRIERRPGQEPDAVWLHFEVRDTGVGIEPDQLERLFAPFVQADSSISRKYGGSGLGLAISKRLVERMGGRIAAESTPGRGSVFRFELPVGVGRFLQPAAQGDLHAPPVKPLRILVAEDVETNRRILQVGLERQGHVLAFAANGEEALQQVQGSDFDLVLMDVQMPVMDGVEATRRIRRLGGRGAAVPILGLTANVMAREREQYLAAGMNDCLMKPFDWGQLVAAVARHGAGLAAAPRREAGAQILAAPTLLDAPTLAALAEMGDPQDVEALLRRALDSFGPACARMLERAAGAEGVRREAHHIRGTAGMLGLRAISEQAGRLESAPDAADVEQQVVALRETMERTIELLLVRGVITRSSVRQHGGAATARVQMELGG